MPRLFLFVLIAAFATPLSTRAQSASPGVERVLESDTLRVLGSSDEWWTRYYEADVLQNPWIEVNDPYGGRVRMPAVYYLATASDLTAFVEGTSTKSVFLLRRSILIPVALIFVIGLITLVAFPFVRRRRRRRRERERRQQRDQTRRRLAESQEAERLRLAQDLHDGPVQDLHALRMRLSMLARPPSGADSARPPEGGLPAGTAPAQNEKVDEVVEEIQRVIRTLRGVSEDLRPPALGPFGLAAALQAFAERFRTTYPSIRVDLDLDHDGQALPTAVRLALFRIAQEGMNNAAQHGAPSKVVVAFRLDEERASLSICDDGSGYQVPGDVRDLGKDGHYGLLGMSERAESIGADLHIESYPGQEKPTCIRVHARRGAAEWQEFSVPSKV